MINVAILGFGVIGSGVYEVIEKNQQIIKEEIFDDVRVKAILDLREFEDATWNALRVSDISKIEQDDSIQIVVESMGGIDIPYDFVKRCLQKGKHVVTSNKALVAAHGSELLRIASEHNVNFMFEASVGGGIPVIRTMAKAYAGEHIKEIMGILNGTTNFILTKMEEDGASFSDVLKEAQALGYAERDPSADVEGHDTCRKIAILSSLACGLEVDYETVYTEGITKVDRLDFAYAKQLKSSIKLIGSAIFDADKLYCFVAPMLVKKANPLYMVKDVYNGIMVEGNMLGKSMLYGSGAGKLPTASAVVADIIACGRHKDKNIPMGWEEKKQAVEPMEYARFQYLLRVRQDVDLASLTEVLGECVILDVVDKEEFAVLTKKMVEREFLAAIAKLDGVIKFLRLAE